MGSDRVGLGGRSLTPQRLLAILARENAFMGLQACFAIAYGGKPKGGVYVAVLHRKKVAGVDYFISETSN